LSVNNVSIGAEAETNTNPVSPRKTLNVLVGIVLGLILGVELAFVRELTDRTVSTESFLTDDLGLISLGTVTEIDQKDIERAVEHKKVQSKLSINKSSRNHRRV